MESDSTYNELEKLVRMESAASNFRDFIKETMPSYDFNWHHEVLIERLNKLPYQKDQRIMVSMPPRHGKSEIVSRRLPAFYLGARPDREIISCSYSLGLASLLNRDVQGIMDSDVYQDIFPDTILPGTEKAKEIPGAKKKKS